MTHPQAVKRIVPFTARVDNYKVQANLGVDPLAEAIMSLGRSWRIHDVMIDGSMKDHFTNDTLVKGKLVCWRWFREQSK